MSGFNYASSLLSGGALSYGPSLPSAKSLPGSSDSLLSAETLPVGSSASTLPAPAPSSLRPPASSGLFGTQRANENYQDYVMNEHTVASRETLPVLSLPNTGVLPHSSPLRNDPFLTHREVIPAAPAHGIPLSSPAVDLRNDPFLSHLRAPEPNEKTPLVPIVDTRADGKFRSRIGNKIMRDDAKLFIIPMAGIMIVQTLISAVVLALSFDETGHRDGYEEGHLDPEDQHSGCQAIFMWLLVQAGIDLFITLVTCAVILSPLTSDPVSFHGCVASLRLCTLAAGFHILYFSGLKRNLCDQPLIVWSTTITWIGIAVMVLVSCYLFTLLTRSSGKSKRQLLGKPQVKTFGSTPDRNRPHSGYMYASTYAQTPERDRPT